MNIWECQSTLFLTLNSIKYIRELNSEHFSSNFESLSFSTPILTLWVECLGLWFQDTAPGHFFRIPYASKHPGPSWTLANCRLLPFQKLQKPTFCQQFWWPPLFHPFGAPPPPTPEESASHHVITCWTSKYCAPAQRNRIFGGHLPHGDVIVMAIFVISENLYGSLRCTQDHSRAHQMTPNDSSTSPESSLIISKNINFSTPMTTVLN